MSNVPDWVFKVLQIFVIPIALWAIATHIAISNYAYRLNQLEQQNSTNSQQIAVQQVAITETKQDLEIMKVRLEYVAKGIDDIKTMLDNHQREHTTAIAK